LDPRTAQRASLLLFVSLLAPLFLKASGTTDVEIWLHWMRQIASKGLLTGYGEMEADYPPLGFAILWGVAKLSLGLEISLFAGLKASLLLALLLTIAVFWAWTRDAVLSAALELVLIPSAVCLAYLDVYFAPVLLLALWALQRGRVGWFAALYTAACLIKWQPLVLLPFLAAYLLGDRVQWRSAFRMLLPAIVALVPLLLLFGTEPVRAFWRVLRPLNLSAHALNVWWVVTHALHSLYPESFGALHRGVSDRIHTPVESWAGILLLRLPFLAFYGGTLALFLRRPRSFVSLVTYSLLGYLGYFMLSLEVHENHLFLAVLLSAVLLWLDRGQLVPFLTWAVASNANMIVFYGFAGTGLHFSRVLGIDMAVPLAVAFMGLFAVHTLSVVRPPP
jgi:hypothetical protein